MADEKIARRAQDIHSGLRDYDDALVSVTVPITTLIGRAALLAVHIRGLERVPNIGGLYRVASQTLGIPASTMPSVLALLEQASWIRVTPNVYAPQLIEETIPVFRSLYVGLSQQWAAMKPGELDQASVALIEALSAGPVPLDQVKSGLGLDDGAFDQITQVGEHGGYVRTYGRGDAQLLYSPLYAEEHPEALLSFVEKHRGKYPEIHSVLQSAAARPGIAVADLRNTHPVVLEMIDANAVTAPAVTSARGTHSFLFPPIRDNVDRAIIQKARVLVSCVRYGAQFGGVTQIMDPAFLLGRLKDQKLIGRKPHTDIKTQYSPAADLGIGYVEDAGDGRYRFHLYDTADNVESVKLAIRLVEGGTEPPAIRLLDETVMQAHVGGDARVVLPEENRGNASKVKKRIKPTSAGVQAQVNSFMDDLRGTRRVR